MSKATATTAATVQQFIPLDLPRVKALEQGEKNALAASIFDTLEKDAKGGFVLPSGKDERKIMAALVAQGIVNPRIGKFVVEMIADGGLTKWLRPYKDTTGLFRSWKALAEYRERETARQGAAAEITALPVYVAK